MKPKPWIPSTLMPRHPNPYRPRKSHKAWDPDLVGKPRFVAGPFMYWKTTKGRRNSVDLDQI